jgi:ABC-2 type transport system permease protein
MRLRRHDTGTGAGADRRAETAITAFSVRRAVRPGLLWGLVFGGMTAATMAAYRSTFPTPGSRASLVRTFQGNPAFEAIFGVTRHMDTVAGYTAYKTLFTLIILGAVWGLLISTRLLRGEEDAGRWELLLAGRTTRRRAARQVVVGLGAGLLALWVPTAVLTVAGGRSPSVGISIGASLFFATAAGAAAAMFMAVGALVSQLAATRHDANLIGAGVIAVSYLIRMAADSDPRIGGLRWASPIGWIEELRPLTGSHWLAFLPIIVLVAAAVAAAVVIAGRRDLGASAFPERSRPEPRTFLLGGQAGLTVRLTRGAIIGWTGALAATGLVLGLVTQSAGESLQGSPALERVIGRLGATGGGAVTYLGFAFVIAAGLVAIAVAGQITAIRNEESAGHLDNLLVRPVARWRWLAVRLAMGIGLIVTASVLTGMAAWVGATTQHAAVGFADLVQAGLNVAPPAVFVLGVGALVFGLWPRAAVTVTYALVVWSFLVETIASVANTGQWLRDTSPLLHITPAPAAAPDWAAAAWLVGLGLLAGAAGVAAFGRRDLQPA